MPERGPCIAQLQLMVDKFAAEASCYSTECPNTVQAYFYLSLLLVSRLSNAPMLQLMPSIRATGSFRLIRKGSTQTDGLLATV